MSPNDHGPVTGGFANNGLLRDLGRPALPSFRSPNVRFWRRRRQFATRDRGTANHAHSNAGPFGFVVPSRTPRVTASRTTPTHRVARATSPVVTSTVTASSSAIAPTPSPGTLSRPSQSTKPTPRTTPASTPNPEPTPETQLEPVARFKAVSSGSYHTCALRDTGEPVCWGAATGSRNDDSIAVAFGQASPPVSERFKSISSGGFHTCALREDGTAVCWGAEPGDSTKSHGQVGFGQTPPPDGEVFASVSSGGRHTCGLREDGAVKC